MSQTPTKTPTAPKESKKQAAKPLAERLAGQAPFDWIKVPVKESK